jgi:hypothetical protein
MKIKKILSTNENATSGSIGWSFIDLTKSSDNWFDQKDSYNLFSFDKTKGYWVYLEEANTTIRELVEPFETNGSISLSLTYNHSFINDTGSASTYNYTTTNILTDGTISVDVSSISDTTLIDRAVATIGGNEIPLSKSGNQYTANIEEITSLSSGDVNVTLFTADNFPATISTTINTTPPTRPSATISDAQALTLELNSSSSTVYFYAYKGDVDTAGTNLVEENITASNGVGSYNLCPDVNFSTNIGAYRFIAMDNANMSNALVSDIGYIGSEYNATFYPIYKNSSILSVTNAATDIKPTDYNSTCGGNTSTSDHGVQLDGVDGYTVTIAFETEDTTLAEAAPADLKEVDLQVDGTKVAHIKFDSGSYSGTDLFLMQYDNNGNKIIYSTQFKVLIGADASSVNFTDDNITMLSGQSISK